MHHRPGRHRPLLALLAAALLVLAALIVLRPAQGPARRLDLAPAIQVGTAVIDCTLHRLAPGIYPCGPDGLA